MPELQELTLEERLKLVQDLWDSIAADTEALPSDREHLVEIRSRLAAYRIDGIKGEPAREVAESIRKAL